MGYRRLALTLCAALLAGVLPACGFGAPASASGPLPIVPTASAGIARTVPPATPTPPSRPVLSHGGPAIGAPSAIVEDLNTGQVLYAKHAGERRPIASLAKIMTAVLVLQRAAPDEWVHVSALAARQPYTALGLKAGTRLRVGTLLKGLILLSANDAAVALAQKVAGSVPAFLALMNARGREIGMTDTRFASPSGLNDAGYATARSVALMTRWAYGTSPAFAALVATRTATLRIPGHRKPERLTNLNSLLWDYRGAVGAKTGFTYKALWCISAVARRGDHSVVAVVLGDRVEPYADAERLLNYGFHQLARGA